MNDDDNTYSDETKFPTTRRRRRGGVTGMVLAELRNYAASLGIDTTGLRRGDLIVAIRQRQMSSGPGTSTTVHTYRDDGTMVTVETMNLGGGRLEERVTTTTLDSATDQVQEVLTKIVRDPVDFDGQGDGDDRSESELANEPAAVGAPPPARLLSLASLLLAPGERENWLGELRTARWELRADPLARRRETWGYFQTLGKSVVTSWRYRGDGPTQEVS